MPRGVGTGYVQGDKEPRVNPQPNGRQTLRHGVRVRPMLNSCIGFRYEI